MKLFKLTKFYLLIIIFLNLENCHKADMNNPLDPNSNPIGTLISILPATSTSIRISDFNPKSGLAGTEVIIVGQNFSSDVSKNSVKFNETIADIVTASTDALTVKVPEGGAITGKISVSSGGQTASTQEQFIVPPLISSFSPSAGAVGTSVTIIGTNFSDVTTNNTVKFNGVIGTITSSANTQIVAVVPSTTTTGYISVDTNGFTSLSTSQFQTNISGSFFYTSNMNYGRYFHTATLLNNGKVLITGGRTNALVFSYAELYDPETGIFTNISNMNSVRYSHTATLLNNGTVLITGGYGTSNAQQSAEIVSSQKS